MPRDSRGLTLPSTGNAGATRPGTTLRPAWLELERHCPGWIEIDELGVMAAINVDEARWDAMRLHEGERLRVVSEDGSYASGAHVRDDAIVLEMAPPYATVAVLITRVRGVPSCGLDLIEQQGFDKETGRGKQLTNQEIGDAIGRHRTLVAREVKRAMGKLKAAGVDLRDLVDEK